MLIVFLCISLTFVIKVIMDFVTCSYPGIFSHDKVFVSSFHLLIWFLRLFFVDRTRVDDPPINGSFANLSTVSLPVRTLCHGIHHKITCFLMASWGTFFQHSQINLNSFVVNDNAINTVKSSLRLFNCYTYLVPIHDI